jgi:hypothetical protein
VHQYGRLPFKLGGRHVGKRELGKVKGEGYATKNNAEPGGVRPGKQLVGATHGRRPHVIETVSSNSSYASLLPYISHHPSASSSN